MAVNRDKSGAKSFLDLSGELRNAVYNHFIDLDPTVGEATALVRSSQQIYSEFGSLCLASGNVAIPTEYINKFLHVFFPHHFDSDPRVISSTTDLSFDWLKSQNWSIGLLKLVTIMHRHSLLKISWFKDITAIISILESMDTRKLAKIISVEYEVCFFSTIIPNYFLQRFSAFFWVTITDAAPELDSFRLGFSPKYGVINVRVGWEYDSSGEEETSESSSGDEDDSDSKEETSDDGDDDEDGEEDVSDSSEGAIESSG